MGIAGTKVRLSLPVLGTSLPTLGYPVPFNIQDAVCFGKHVYYKRFERPVTRISDYYNLCHFATFFPVVFAENTKKSRNYGKPVS